jgi:hypothetical protein
MGHGVGFVEGTARAELPEAGKPAGESNVATATETADPNLRSFREVSGYHVNAADGEIGHVEDLIVDDSNWVLRYAVVDTRNWLPGRKVLVAIPWFHDVSWGSETVSTALTQDEIKNSPEFKPDEPINRQYEEVLYDFYGRRKYWL